MQPPYPMGAEELKDLLRRAHQLVVAKLPKKRQIGLLL
jgi:predicted DNA-binding protein (MmcQ/YjbR family)